MVLRQRGAPALVNRRLYLSQAWVSGASHAARRRRTGVAEGSLPVRWVTCDEGFSVRHAFLDGVAALGLGYLAEVARNTHV